MDSVYGEMGDPMRVQTFLSKVNMESLQQMDEHINAWLSHHNVEPKIVKQSFGYERPRDAAQQDPVIIVTVWY